MVVVCMKYEERISIEVFYMCEKGYTIRQIGKTLNISKSTVYNDLTEKLKEYSIRDYLRVRQVLDLHRNERHIKGGEATRLKYLALKS